MIFYYITISKKLYIKQKATSEKLTLTNQELNRQHETITDSMQYAERIQTAVLPPEDFFAESLKNYFILFKPREIVSGDFYWAIRLDEKLVIAVADCTGHGVPGALLSMLGMSFLNEIVNRTGSIQANQILDMLRTDLITSLHQSGKKGEARDGMEIALCIVDKQNGLLEYSGANRPLYLIRETDLEGDRSEGNYGYELVQYQADKMPIGIYDQEMKPFTNHVIQLQKNDSAYLFTDGYLDQKGGPVSKTFKSHRFRKLLLDIQHESMEMQKNILMERFESWKGDIEQIDDVLVLGFKVSHFPAH
jgi:serine phosphatase RsbU (regulator of sigma subunit)